jgi:hypothetical protein
MSRGVTPLVRTKGGLLERLTRRGSAHSQCGQSIQ